MPVISSTPDDNGNPLNERTQPGNVFLLCKDGTAICTEINRLHAIIVRRVSSR